jgi:hypothetical protein
MYKPCEERDRNYQGIKIQGDRIAAEQQDEYKSRQQVIFWGQFMIDQDVIQSQAGYQDDDVGNDRIVRLQQDYQGMYQVVKRGGQTYFPTDFLEVEESRYPKPCRYEDNGQVLDDKARTEEFDQHGGCLLAWVGKIAGIF